MFRRACHFYGWAYLVLWRLWRENWHRLLSWIDSADSDQGGKNLSEECDARGGEHTGKECDAVVDSEPIATSIWKWVYFFVTSVTVFWTNEIWSYYGESIIWTFFFLENRGTLKLSDKNFELMCHLSTSACRKVHEKTSQLPDVLNADLLERSTVLPEYFRRCGTSNHSIDLYFFPQDERWYFALTIFFKYFSCILFSSICIETLDSINNIFHGFKRYVLSV